MALVLSFSPELSRPWPICVESMSPSVRQVRCKYLSLKDLSKNKASINRVLNHYRCRSAMNCVQ